MTPLQQQARAVLNAYEEGYVAALLKSAEIKYGYKEGEEEKLPDVKLYFQRLLLLHEQDVEYWVKYYFND